MEDPRARVPLSCLIQERYEDRGGDKVDSGTGNRRLLWKRERISSRVSQLTSYLPTAGNSSSTTIHDAPWNWFWRIAMGLSRQPLSLSLIHI